MKDALKELLKLVVEEIITTGEPVGSQYLVEEHDLDASSATIRNWFAILEEEGYLSQPHASAGRVPTEKGYRFYLQELMKERALQRQEMERLRRAASDSHFSSDELRFVAKTLSDFVQDALVVVNRHSETHATGLSRVLSQPEFADRERVTRFSDMFDRVDETLEELREMPMGEPTALIGKDCPFGEDCGSVFLQCHDGTLLGFFGSIRMDYPRHFALMRTAQRLLTDDE
jgi:transcriptional regulator of heat shock response